MFLPKVVSSFVAAASVFAFCATATLSWGQPRPAQGSGAPADPFVVAIPRWDADHDGVLTCTEWKEYAERLFRRADKNSDGFLSREEFVTVRQLEPVFANADLAYFDDNQDGRVSLREFVDKPNPVFARYDRNRDCQVTPEEINGGAADSRPAPGPGGRKPRL
jgi:EF hand